LAVLSLPNNLTTKPFKIETGVKQGAILSSFLFNIYIDDLIIECLNNELGALIKNLNVSIIVYADDIILISPVDSHLQMLLDICGSYENIWRIKFNPNKTKVVNFVTQLFKSVFHFNGSELEEANQLEYLGFIIDSNLDLNTQAVINFKKFQSSFFGISYLLPKNSPTSSPKFKSFMYKTFCLSKFTYGLEALTLNSTTKDSINKLQNNLIRQMFGLKSYCHMSRVLKNDRRIFEDNE
ncbi:RNA-directed DNA polymerase from mobile element jockey-like, partial [Brachionus plicatilis]